MTSINNQANSAFFRSASKRILTPKNALRKVTVGQKIQELLGSDPSAKKAEVLNRIGGDIHKNIPDLRQNQPQLSVLRQNRVKANQRRNAESMASLDALS